MQHKVKRTLTWFNHLNDTGANKKHATIPLENLASPNQLPLLSTHPELGYSQWMQLYVQLTVGMLEIIKIDLYVHIATQMCESNDARWNINHEIVKLQFVWPWSMQRLTSEFDFELAQPSHSRKRSWWTNYIHITIIVEW